MGRPVAEHLRCDARRGAEEGAAGAGLPVVEKLRREGRRCEAAAGASRGSSGRWRTSAIALDLPDREPSGKVADALQFPGAALRSGISVLEERVPFPSAGCLHSLYSKFIL